MHRSNTIQSKKSAFFGDLLQSTMHKHKSFMNRSFFHLSVDKEKFKKSVNFQNYNAGKDLQRSKSLCESGQLCSA